MSDRVTSEVLWHLYDCSGAREATLMNTGKHFTWIRKIRWWNTTNQSIITWAPSQYPKRRLSVRSRKVSKPRDWYFKLSYRFEIWQAHRQHCCRSAWQISKRSDNFKYKSRGFETLRDLTERRFFGYWDGAQNLFMMGYTVFGKWSVETNCKIQWKLWQVGTFGLHIPILSVPADLSIRKNI